MRPKISRLILIGSVLSLVGCGGIFKEFSKRSELTLEARAGNAVDDGGERATVTRIELHGNNRDVLAAYKNAFEFTLEKLGLLKK